MYKPYLVIATISELENLRTLIPELKETGTNVIVIDEGDESIRHHNNKILIGIEKAFYGPNERAQWFKERFGESYEKYLSIIPERAHAETSFGFLVCKEKGADFIVELDDDVFAKDLIADHRSNLFEDTGETVTSSSRWYNTLESLELSSDSKHFPRGHPYVPEARAEGYYWKKAGGKCVLNMGHWTGNPDFDALTILYHGGMDGRCNVKGLGLRREKVIVEQGTYFAVCSMNTSFLLKIIPAFYQLYMNTMGIDRFDDIWSGIFLKRIADHLNDKVCLGKPAGIHQKRARNVFKDLQNEMNGMIINESIWKIIDGDISGSSYADAYLSLVDLLEKGTKSFGDENYRRFLKLQVEKMRLWVDIVDLL